MWFEPRISSLEKATKTFNHNNTYTVYVITYRSYVEIHSTVYTVELAVHTRTHTHLTVVHATSQQGLVEICHRPAWGRHQSCAPRASPFCFLLFHSAEIKVLWNSGGSSSTARPAMGPALFISPLQTHSMRRKACTLKSVLCLNFDAYCNQDFYDASFMYTDWSPSRCSCDVNASSWHFNLPIFPYSF